MLINLKKAAKRIKEDAITVYFAARDPRTPIIVRLLAFAIAAYAISPIDLIPDFIPVLGILDDIILLPLGIMLVVRLTPKEVLVDCRIKAQELAAKPTSRTAAAIIVLIWIFSAVTLGYWLM
ncbi:MAG: YkvA family protein [Oleibacter sp.]|nr:YkvA family protein [Thalassolituus sp.]